MFSGTSEILIFMTPPMRKLCFRGSGHMLFCTCLWSFSRCVSGRQLCFFLTVLGALRAPFRHLWGHITAVFLLLIFSRYLRCIFITFRVPRGTPNGRRRHRRRPSGVLVKHHLASGSDGSTEVEPHLVNLHPGALP